MTKDPAEDLRKRMLTTAGDLLSRIKPETPIGEVSEIVHSVVVLHDSATAPQYTFGPVLTEAGAMELAQRGIIDPPPDPGVKRGIVDPPNPG
jgi:hypothetical protein